MEWPNIKKSPSPPYPIKRGCCRSIESVTVNGSRLGQRLERGLQRRIGEADATLTPYR